MSKSGAERVKASTIRKKSVKGIPLSDDEDAYLNDYEDSKPEKRKGRSASSRTVHLDIEEQAAAEGDHVHPEAYAAAVAASTRAEGLRADTLLNIVTTKLLQCNDQYLRLMNIMVERSLRLEEAHIGLLDAVRESHLARIDAEGETRMLEHVQAIKEMAGTDGDGELAQLVKLLELAVKNNANVKQKPRKKNEKPLGVVD